MSINEFQELIWEKSRELFRPMPWRDDTRPYYVLVSEIMLQQTQVERVLPKFEAFIRRFPSIEVLSAAPLAEVLQLWSGLGYNRRAKYLWETARMIQHEYGGVFPKTLTELCALPGVGQNTAGAIMTYSFNAPVVFIETNVRTVFFYHFFKTENSVSDAQIKELVEQTLDLEHPREWYWALMDYGAYLKRNGAGANNKSTHYKKQSPLKGSLREVRGLIVKALSQSDMTQRELRSAVIDDERFPVALEGLLRDGIIMKTKGKLHLAR